jgi:hypothetical protein
MIILIKIFKNKAVFLLILKRLASILLVILLTWQTIFNVGFFIYWRVNQTFIAENLCENRNKPQMHCNGKCYLFKKMKQAEEEENAKNSLPNAIPNFKSVDNFVFQNHDWNIEFTSLSFQKPKFTPYSSNLLIGNQNSIFRPPKFI